MKLFRNIGNFSRMLIRVFIRVIGKLIFGILTRTTINGRINFPAKGPLLITANHAGMIELALLTIYLPYHVEYLGSGDIPLDPNFAWLAKIYGYIPVKRGSLDRKALSRSEMVLKKGGILVIFPEGGIWNPGAMKARVGAAFLSERTQTPILPIGFEGIRNGLKEILLLKRPQYNMNVGELISPVQFNQNELSRKQNLEQASAEIMSAINKLAQTEIIGGKMYVEASTLSFFILDNERKVSIPDEFKITHEKDLAALFSNPVMMSTFKRNLKLPVLPLIQGGSKDQPVRYLRAVEGVLNYLEQNPAFLTYRFGMDRGFAMKQGLEEMAALLKWVVSNRFYFHFNPVLETSRKNQSIGIAEESSGLSKE